MLRRLVALFLHVLLLLLEQLHSLEVLVPVGLALARQDLVCLSLLHVALHLLKIVKLLVVVLCCSLDGGGVWSIGLLLLQFVVLLLSADFGHEIRN